MARDNTGAVGTYILIALILGVITYVEFAIVEWPQAWLGSTWTLITLAVLSVIKFILVVMFFMHLKGDDRMYSGFFSSGMVIALATFIAMTAMFILPRAMSYQQSNERTETLEAASAAHGGDHGDAHVPEDVEELIVTDGDSRPAADRADAPAPTDRRLTVEPPAAANDGAGFSLADAEPAGGDVAEDVPADEDVQAEEPDAPEVAGDARGDEQPETEAEGLRAEPEAEEVAETAADDAGEAADAAPAEVEEPADEPAADADAEAEEPEAPAQAAADWDRDMGAQVYAANCVGCHQGAGQGVPGAFPPLAGNASDIHAAGGRDYLVQAVLFGLQGQIAVDGMTYNGFMPAWPQLSDDQIANVLNHVVAELGEPPADFTPYAAADVAAHRGDGLSGADVHEVREQLGLN